MSVLDDIENKMNELGNNAVQKTKEASEIMSLKAAINEEERKIKNVYSQIGELFYTKKDEAKDELDQLCKTIDESRQKIADMKKQILVLKKIVECPQCGHENPETASFCLKCGTKLIHTINDGKHCQNCGAPLTEGQLFCTRCGTKVEKQDAEENEIKQNDVVKEEPVVEDTLPVDEPVVEEVVPVEEPVAKEQEVTSEEETTAPVEEIQFTKCPKCGKEVKPGQLFCTGCGTNLKDLQKTSEATPEIKQDIPKPEVKVCPSCHSPIKEGQKFCIVCGEKLEAPKRATPKKVCPSCGLEIEGDKDKCDICGADLKATQIAAKCPQCGKEVKPGQAFCTGCGRKL